MSEITDITTRFVKNVQDLDVFKLAYSVSLEIHKASLQFPKTEQYALADQLRRCSKSICANLAEGFAKQPHSNAEFRRFLSMAIGSSGEMQVWISYCSDLGYIEEIMRQSWAQAYDRISRMLQKLRSSIRN